MNFPLELKEQEQYCSTVEQNKTNNMNFENVFGTRTRTKEQYVQHYRGPQKWGIKIQILTFYF